MADEKLQLSDYQIGNEVSGVSYFSGDQKTLVRAALNILSSKYSGLEEGATKDMLRGLDNLGLISSGGVDSLMKRLFKK